MNRAERRAAARAGIDPQTLDLARCPDCSSEVELAASARGVLALNVRHDGSCPTYRRHLSSRGAWPDRPPGATP